jgi:RNA polymerase sigma-70 factor, ECF subfamily
MKIVHNAAGQLIRRNFDRFLSRGTGMRNNADETRKLLEQVQHGDQAAFEALFQRHRAKLRRTIALRMDRRVAARVDASDVLQDAYLEAFKRLPKYLQQQGMPFYLWLCWIAREKVLALHRRHLGAEKRAVIYEAPLLPADSSSAFVSAVIAGREPTPSQALAKTELAEQLRQALEKLDDDERDLILWRHFEQLSARDTAQLLQISEAAASKRYIRAVERLRAILADLGVSRPG